MPKQKVKAELNMAAPFICPECSEKFPTYQARYQHRRQEHNVKPKKPGQWKAVGKKYYYAKKNGTAVTPGAALQPALPVALTELGKPRRKLGRPVKSNTKGSTNGNDRSHESISETFVSRQQADLENAINRIAGRVESAFQATFDKQVEFGAVEFSIPTAITSSGVAELLHNSPSRALLGIRYSLPRLRS